MASVSSSDSIASSRMAAAAGRWAAPRQRAFKSFAVLAAALWQTQHACALTTRSVMDGFINNPEMAPLAANESMDTDIGLELRPIRRPDGTLGFAEVPESRKRPFQLAFYEVVDPGVPQATRTYISNTIMPGVANLLARFVRVRFPSGPLQFNGRPDTAGQPIPDGPGPGGTYDADLVIKVRTSTPATNPECDGPIAFALAVLFETLTRRPTFGEITFCLVTPQNDIAASLAVALHEHMHVLGFAGDLFSTYFGFQDPFDVTAVAPGIPDDDYDYRIGATGRFAYAYDALYAAYTPGAAPSNYDLDFALEFLGYSTTTYADADTPASSLTNGTTTQAIDAYAADYGTNTGAGTNDGYLAEAGGPPTPPSAPPPPPPPEAAAPLTNILDAVYGDGYGARRRFDPVTPFTLGITTPNALREAREHIGCPSMEFVLLQESATRLTSHWSSRHYRGELMQARTNQEGGHFDREAITDLTLGLLQDTGWYDVKYGSGGFNTYGYRAGCGFVNVNNTIDEILEDPAARQYLCTRGQVGTAQCFHDFSGSGICQAELLLGYDDLYSVEPLADYVDDCQEQLGSRCIAGVGDGGDPLCAVGFSCSEDGRVLIDGAVCSELTAGCPPDGLMCGDPGLLTCAGPDLNDCNGRGDCREGRCFCHTGFGGDDCSVPVCTGGCADGSPCPPSGFCGVPTCGAWSVGDSGQGDPCGKE